MSDYDFMFDSEVVDVSTRGIDRGEDDYVPTDEYTPGVDDDEPAVNAAVMVAWDDVSESFALAMRAEGIPEATITTIVLTVFDAVDNNS